MLSSLISRICILTIIAACNVSQVQAFNDTDTASPNIFINAIMRSASDHIANMLETGLAYNWMIVTSVYNDKNDSYESNIDEFFSKHAQIAKQHFNPPVTKQGFRKNVLDLEKYKRYSDRIVINVRDPHQALLSWVHYVNKLHDTGNFTAAPPQEYYGWSLEKQIDWGIENYLPSLVAWMDGWLLTQEQESEKPNGLKFLFTTYEELMADELGLLHKILAFYDIPQSRFHYKPIARKEALHFRKGDPNEWRQVFTQAQKNRIAQILPQQLMLRFNWKA